MRFLLPSFAVFLAAAFWTRAAADAQVLSDHMSIPGVEKALQLHPPSPAPSIAQARAEIARFMDKLVAFAVKQDTLLNDYFTEADYKNNQAYGLFEPGKMQNSWHEFDAAGAQGKYLVVALEYGPRDAAVEGAGGVIAARPDRKVILVTHAYVYRDSTRYDWGHYGTAQHGNPKAAPGLVADGGVNDAEDLWRKVVSRHSRVELIVNVQVRTYSPWYDRWLTQPDQQFSLSFAPAAA